MDQTVEALLQRSNHLAVITWDEFDFTDFRILGKGSYGMVVTALWQSLHSSKTKVKVALKVLSFQGEESDRSFIFSRALEETKLLRQAEQRILYKDAIVKTYGAVQGPLPEALRLLLKLKPGEVGIGIIMRFVSFLQYVFG
jgi:hypothetical protein